MLRRLTASLAALVLTGGLIVAVPSAALAATGPVAVIDAARTSTSTTGDVVLAWKPVTGATSYEVQIATNDSFGTEYILDKITTNALTWVPTTGLWGVGDAQTLYWRVIPAGVQAVASDAPVYEFERAEGPAPVLSLPVDGASIDYPTPLQLSWEPVPGATSYTLTYNTPGTTVVQTVAGLTAPSYTFKDPLDAATWEWSVRALFRKPGSTSATVSGARSPVRTFTTSWLESESTPVLEYPGEGATLNDLNFTWSAVDGASKYTFELSLDEAFTNLALSSEVTGTTFIPTQVLPSTTYYWRVKATGTGTYEGKYSDVRQVRKIMGVDATPVPSTPSADTTAPQLLVGSAELDAPAELNFDEFEIAWTPVPRANHYEVEVTQINGGLPVTCSTASASATILAKHTYAGNQRDLHKYAGVCLWSTDKSRAIRPDNDKAYVVRVRAVNISATETSGYTNGDANTVVPSSWSPRRYFTVTAGSTTPTADVEPITSSILQTSEASPTLRWKPVDGADGYRVQLFTDTGESSQVGEYWTPTPVLRSIGVFERNTTTASNDAYRAVISATSDGESGQNWPLLIGPAEGTIDWKRVGDAPQAGTVTDQAGTKVLGMAPTPADALGGANRGYQVQIQPAGSTTTYTLKVDQPMTAAVRSIATSNKKVTLTALASGEYSFRYAILDAAGNAGPFSPPTSFTIGQGTTSTLTHTAGSNGNSANLSWQSAVSASSYEVYLQGQGESVRKIADTSQTAVTVVDLVPTKQYAWWLVSVDKDKNKSAPSASASFSLPESQIVPTTPTQTLNPEQLVLSWPAVPGASRYVVRLAEDGKNYTSSGTYETSATSFAPVTKLAYGTRYQWDVRAVPEKVDSSSSRPVIARSTDRTFAVATLPGAVSNLRATVDGRSAQLTWPQLSGPAIGAPGTIRYVVAYRVKPDIDTSAGWTSLTPVANAASQTISGLATKTTYQFRVAAINSVGQGPWSNIPTASTIGPPNVVTDLTTTTNALGTLRLSWRAPSGSDRASGYTVRYRTGTGAWSTLTSTSTSLTLEKLANGKPYAIEVNAFNAVGAGPVASTSATTVSVPSAARSPKVKRGDTTVKVSWAAPSSTGGSPITGYTVQVRSKAPKAKKWSAWSTAGSTSATVRTLTASRLTNGTAYQFRVLAKNRYGNAKATAAKQATPAGKPLAPQSVKATSTKKKTVKVAWKAAPTNGAKVTKHVVQYSTNGKKWKTLKSVKASAKSYTWKKGKSKSVYSFRVYAVNGLGSGAKSSAVKVTVK